MKVGNGVLDGKGEVDGCGLSCLVVERVVGGRCREERCV